MTLQRLILTFKPEGLEARVLYRSEATAGAGPGTRARQREVAELTRTGLQRALRALDAGDVADLGTSGFTTREDTFLCTTKGEATTGEHKKPTDKGAA